MTRQLGSPLSKLSGAFLGALLAASCNNNSTSMSPDASQAFATAAVRHHHGTDTREAFAKEFASPTSRAVKPASRWWVPNGNLDPAEVVREIDSAAAAGFGTLEVNNLVMSSPIFDPDPYFTSPTDQFLASYGWGSGGWRSTLQSAVAEADKKGLEVDFMITPDYSANVPLDVNGAGASKELLYTTAPVAGGDTFDAVLAEPPAKSTADAAATPLVPTFVAVTAARVENAEASPVVLDATSLVDLTSQVTTGDSGPRLNWTAPAGADQWLVFAFWQRSTGQVFSMVFPSTNRYSVNPAYTVDHFGVWGAHALISYWQANLLTHELKALLAKNGGAIFEDSLEYSFSGQKWTPGMLEQFEWLRRYDLTPYLPLLAVETSGGFGGGTTYKLTVSGDYLSGLRDRVVEDFEQTVSDLYVKNHIEPIKAWAHRLGLKYRAQPYISGATEAACDIPEGERLAFGTNDDAFRTVAAAAHLAGRNTVSNELIPSHFPIPGFGGVFMNNLYAITFADVVNAAGREFALGINRHVLHGIPYSGALKGASLQPDDTIIQWPGWYPFGINFSEAWGRGPQWTHMTDLTGWFSRNQLVLQTGKPRVDVAVLARNLDFQGAPTFTDSGLSQAGYSYDRVSPSLLALELATVKHGVLAPKGPSYKALIVDQQSTMPLATARSLLAWAAAGLPIVVVGDAPSKVPSYRRSTAGLLAGVNAADQHLQTMMELLLARSNVIRVDTEAQVPVALGLLGVEPDAKPAAPTALLSAHRVGDGVDYYLLVNDGSTDLVTAVSLKGSGCPYLLDAWTGDVEAIALYDIADGRTIVPVKLAPQQTTIIAIDSRSPACYWMRHAITSDCEVVYTKAGELAVRSTSAGTCTTILDDSTAVASTITAVPVAQEIGGWHLKIVGWGPGADAYSTVTSTVYDSDLTALVSWTSIAGLENVSGVGTYTTTVALDSNWTSGLGAYLELGAVVGSARVTINGTQLPTVDVKILRIDVGPYLSAGTNTIAVEVATSLSNQVTKVNTRFAGRELESYGLLGPVTLIPYEQVVVTR